MNSLTQTEQILAEQWCKLLDVSEIDTADNFLDLGGHSLLAARAASEIQRTFGATVSVKTLMIRSLSQVAAEVDRFAASQHEQNDEKCEPASASQSPNVGRLAGWFKKQRNGDRFQDG
jgi:Phosphopantetheine attachment site